MIEPIPNRADDALDLEADSFDELGRDFVSRSENEELRESLSEQWAGRQTNRRCDSADRELLRNHFPVE